MHDDDGLPRQDEAEYREMQQWKELEDMARRAEFGDYPPAIEDIYNEYLALSIERDNAEDNDDERQNAAA